MKKTLLRRSVSLFLVILLIMSCASVTAFAAPAYNADTKVLRMHNSGLSLNQLKSFLQKLERMTKFKLPTKAIQFNGAE